MELVWIILMATAILIFVVFAIAFVCFFITFYVPQKAKKPKAEFDLPPGDEYLPFHNTMIKWMKEVRTFEYKDMYITSFDGLKLHARYYEYSKGAPIEIMFHGYRGNADRDLCGGVQRCFSLGRNVLLVDQRAASKSEGNVISFGINESRDCLGWIDKVTEVFGKEQKIILCGISMGASTVLMAAGNPLPKNVIGVLADCGYTSAEEIIKKVIKQLKLPLKASYFFVSVGARLFGRFNLKNASATVALKKCKIPVIFMHGEKDGFVPFEMSVKNYAACTSVKRLVAFPEADHGTAYLVDPEKYLNEIVSFSEHMGIKTTRV